MIYIDDNNGEVTVMIPRTDTEEDNDGNAN